MHTYSLFGIIVGLGNALLSADPVDLGAQSDLIGAPQPMSTEAVLAASVRRLFARGQHHRRAAERDF